MNKIPQKNSYCFEYVDTNISSIFQFQLFVIYDKIISKDKISNEILMY